MSYLTLEVEIDHGRIVSPEGFELPEKAKGFLTILSAALPSPGLQHTARSEPRPIGLAKGEFTVPADFNAPLPENVMKAFEGE